MGNNIVEIGGVTKSYGDKKGIFDIDLKIPKGKVFGLLGRNGAGKSTLLKSIVGLIAIDRGSIKIDGLDHVKDGEKILRKTGFVDEDKTLYNWMSVGEILDFTSSFYDTWDMDYANMMLSEFKIEKNRKIGELSRGQKAEISLLLSLAFHPKLLILDEPASGLDIVVREEFMEKFIQFVCDEERTIIISSHLLDDVERICDQIAFIEKGKIIYVSDMEELREKYRKYLSKNGKNMEYFGLKDIFISTVKNGFRI